MKALFASENIVRKGLLSDEMYMYTWSKSQAIKSEVIKLNEISGIKRGYYIRYRLS